MGKIVKVFEKFIEDELVKVEDEKLRPGEKRALAQGLQLITEPQMAVLFLVAKHRLARREDASDTYAGRMAQHVSRDLSNEDFRDVPYGRLSDFLDMNPLTVSRTTNKFMLLIKGEEKESEVLYAKIIDAYNMFKEMQEAEVLALAEQALNYSADTTKSDAYRETLAGQAAKSKDNKVLRTRKVGMAVKTLYNQLKPKFGELKSARMAVSTVSADMELDQAEVKALAQEFMKTEPTLRNLFK
jgi:hypothetical protein